MCVVQHWDGKGIVGARAREGVRQRRREGVWRVHLVNPRTVGVDSQREKADSGPERVHSVPDWLDSGVPEGCASEPDGLVVRVTKIGLGAGGRGFLTTCFVRLGRNMQLKSIVRLQSVTVCCRQRKQDVLAVS